MKSIVVVFTMTMLFACKPDIKTVTIYGEIDTLPELSARNIEYIRSDSGKVQAILTGPLMYQYTGDKEYFEFPEGFKVEFFDDSSGKVKSVLTADYGIGRDRNKILEARRNVVIINYLKNERLDTEELIWDQRKKSIYSNLRVKITTNEDIIIGDTLIADESFDNYTLKHPTGEFEFEEDEK